MVAENTFEKVAREWHRTMLNKWQPPTADDILHRFELDVFAALGQMPIAAVQPRDVRVAIRAVEERGALEIANRLTANCWCSTVLEKLRKQISNAPRPR
jgi:integrase